MTAIVAPERLVSGGARAVRRRAAHRALSQAAEPARDGDARRPQRAAVHLRAGCSAGARPARARRCASSKLLPGLALAFEVEPLGMLFALVASGLWIVNSIYSIGYMRANDEAAPDRASTSASRWRSAARSASPSPPTCSRCSCSTRC